MLLRAGFHTCRVDITAPADGRCRNNTVTVREGKYNLANVMIGTELPGANMGCKFDVAGINIGVDVKDVTLSSLSPLLCAHDQITQSVAWI